jgi:hypothetical protein
MVLQLAAAAGEGLARWFACQVSTTSPNSTRRARRNMPSRLSAGQAVGAALDPAIGLASSVSGSPDACTCSGASCTRAARRLLVHMDVVEALLRWSPISNSASSGPPDI